MRHHYPGVTHHSAGLGIKLASNKLSFGTVAITEQSICSALLGPSRGQYLKNPLATPLLYYAPAHEGRSSRAKRVMTFPLHLGCTYESWSDQRHMHTLQYLPHIPQSLFLLLGDSEVQVDSHHFLWVFFSVALGW